jgi:hypothetical protein
MTLSITTFNIKTLSIKAFSKTTLSIRTFSITIKNATFNIKTLDA